jgi:hypothetical protein
VGAAAEASAYRTPTAHVSAKDAALPPGAVPVVFIPVPTSGPRTGSNTSILPSRG